MVFIYKQHVINITIFLKIINYFLFKYLFHIINRSPIQKKAMAMTMTSIDIESETHNIEKQIDIPNIDILKTLKQAVFDAFKQKPKKPRKK